MDLNMTDEQLNSLPKDVLIALFIAMRSELKSTNEQLAAVNNRLDALTEQITLSNNYRFGRHTEKGSELSGQLSFNEDGVFFNEAEAVNDACPDPKEVSIEEIVRNRRSRPVGKKQKDLEGFEVMQLPLRDVSEEERIKAFSSLDNCRRMDDEIYQRLIYIPAGWRVEEEHVAVYRSKKGEAKFIKGETPKYLLRGSYVSPSLEAAIINAKYVNAAPLRRIEKEFERNGIPISEQNMAYWTIQCADRYLNRVTDYMKKLMVKESLLQADETTVNVAKDGRKAGSKSYMWVYRTGPHRNGSIVLYDYQKTRNHEHPLNFLDGFKGTLVCDGFSGYKTLSRKAEDIRISECWTHARRKFTDAVKANVNSPQRARAAQDAIKMIAAIYHADSKLKDLSVEERQKARDRDVRPLVDAYFAWIKGKKNDSSILLSEKTRNGFTYSLNQEPYLKAFLEDGYLPLDNNLTERTIRSFTVGRRNWMTIDTVSGAKSSAVIYSLVETAKENGLNPYAYFKYLLTELPKLKEFNSDQEESAAMERLLPWSSELPAECHKRGRQ